MKLNKKQIPARHRLTDGWSRDLHLVKIYAAIVEISSAIVEISSELVEISSELVSTNWELLIINAFRFDRKAESGTPVSRRTPRSGETGTIYLS
ncbi:MAG: hypothetical protein UDG28_02175 [Prevotellamassilia sp.]|nr:hypothetical protein [Prevotellamassilia sp.]